MTSPLELKAYKIDVVGAISSRCWPAQLIAALLKAKAIPATASLDALQLVLAKKRLPYVRNTTPVGDWLSIGGSWVVGCHRDRWSVYSSEFFPLRAPSLPPATSVALAA